MKYTRVWIACLLALPMLGQAVSLSEPLVRTGLGQRFIAEIDVRDLDPSLWVTLNAAVASPETYKDQGVSYPPAVEDMSVFVLRHQDGRPYIRVVGHHPLNEAFLNLMLDVGWKGGHLIRKYTVLPEPPVNDPRQQDGYDGLTLQQRIERKERRFEKRKIDPADQITGTAEWIRRTESERAPADDNEEDTDKPLSNRYLVRSGDNLYQLARRWRVPDLGLYQRILAIYYGNHDLFMGGNPNRLIRGRWVSTPKTLSDVPDTEDEAKEEWRVLLHSPSEWHSGAHVPEADESSSMAQEDEDKENAELKSSHEHRQQRGRWASMPSAKDLDRLTISRGMSRKDIETYQRLLEMENQIKQLIDDVHKRSPKLAMSDQLDNSLPSDQGVHPNESSTDNHVEAATEPPIQQTQLPVSATQPGTEQQTSSQGPMPVTPVTSAQAPRAQIPASAATSMQKPAGVKPLQTKRPPRRAYPLPPAPVEYSGFMGTPWWVEFMGISGFAVAAGAGIIMWRRRRQRQVAVENLLKESAELTEAASIFTDTGQSIVEAAASPPDLTEAGSLNRENLLNVDTDTHIDPLTEADVYITYERYEAAEALLKTALEQQPESRDILWRLLLVYQKWGRPIEMKSFAERLHRMFDARDPKQRTICEILGVDFGSLVPEEASTDEDIETESAHIEALSVEEGSLNTDKADSVSEESSRGPEKPKPSELSQADEKMNLLKDKIQIPGAVSTPLTEAKHVEERSNSIDLEIETKTDNSSEEELVAAKNMLEQSMMLPALSFDKNEMGVGAVVDVPPLDFDFSEMEKEADEKESVEETAEIEDDPIQSQLELAKIWMVQGKLDAARVLLEAIMETGTTSQKSRAKLLFDELGDF